MLEKSPTEVDAELSQIPPNASVQTFDGFGDPINCFPDSSKCDPDIPLLDLVLQTVREPIVMGRRL
jgi:hypothetical protein